MNHGVGTGNKGLKGAARSVPVGEGHVEAALTEELSRSAIARVVEGVGGEIDEAPGLLGVVIFGNNPAVTPFHVDAEVMRRGLRHLREFGPVFDVLRTFDHRIRG